MIFIPSWRWTQRRQSCVALRALLTRLLSPGALVRLALLAVLPRLVVPLLTVVTSVPASLASTTSMTVASIIALGASTEVTFVEDPELLTVVGVVAVHVVEDAERMVAFGRLRVITVALHL